jgi:ribose transport system permease protein
MTAPVIPPDEEVADEAPAPEAEAPLWRRLLGGSSVSIALILFGLIFVFSVLRFEEFFAVSNARNIATDAAVLLVLATGLTYVIITAGIDLSVGSVLVFSGVVSAKLMNSVGGNGGERSTACSSPRPTSRRSSSRWARSAWRWARRC